MIVMGIESSCDETSVSIVAENKTILSLCTVSDLVEHRKYGGVVPEIAARNHLEHITDLVSLALFEANLDLERVDAFAVTAGPGLIGGLIVGVMTAKALASAMKKPCIAVNHLEAHVLTIRLVEDIDFPYISLLISGGHCQFLEVLGVGKYRKLGGTIDDALGETFDKVAKMLNLSYPGGPAIEKLAAFGDKYAYDFPKPLLKEKSCDFSFAGLKTAIKRTVDKLEDVEREKADICASFQRTVVQILQEKIKHAVRVSRVQNNRAFVVSGGVASNLYIRQELDETLKSLNFQLYTPPLSLCTDNAAMVAWTGVERFRLGLVDELSFAPKPRWPLDIYLS
ncbi:tRNA (adenosine(37)-N6)-threonylcarbamoyltransferase complex transferase subunit TsaD [Rickettsiales endosymbiont of Peranema trichophorum]|uniref:tRNA (adenosine(37)-N6)-threonylcarbamoyltransferase complex transferase subunit TsaD n=1 Tax=Rickettsiales endosymbiont of Peranema trichophorum TaxID=2486577 RepID=UPI001023302E|nr:tRNA (adenosine(37)-N6)-threonylcarbamoyltransferase complex transferase subunit TsaD [Rickettsiales endosymbiont of Peranema trichophorum]RZI45544.1 tRNA (adenosine(37)-N6)-threonylcarbamoyltransferase complex transferase subunit TsaD [Rickettsiales endosymbiont of Peranema trichophorum]